MAKQSELEKAAIEARKQLLAKNEYNSSDSSKEYSANHPNAKSDGDNKGRDTGIYLDSSDNVGTSEDIQKRIALKAKNEYNKNKKYETPDTTGNIGQIVI
jgi:hypothetical protein